MSDDRFQERLAQLMEENEHLRQAARSFGELAERLMKELTAERRRTARMNLAPIRKRHRPKHLPVA